MTKEEIANVLERIAILLELKAENPFKIRAYTNAARAIETFGGNVSNFQDEEAVGKIPGIGKSIALKIKELAATGSLKYLEELSSEFPTGIMKFFVSHRLVESVIAQGPTKSSLRLRSGVQCDLRVVSTAEYPFALAYFTGNKEHNIELRSRALQRGWTLNEYRLAPVPVDSKAKKKRPIRKIPKVRDEAGLYRAVDLDFIPPELRENWGEFEAAEKHSLPKLIEKENLRGTFHCHTLASDGHNSFEEMAEAAQALGLEYLGIADHSRSQIQAHGLDEKQLLAQVAAIRKLNKTFNGFRLFAGVECDILRDGSLDFPDEVLSQLDYVVASVHSALGLSEADMTRRMIRAMENPFVSMLAHPTGRLLLKREPNKINIPKILDAAARTGTWIELNAAPKRLDLDWRWWPMAKQKGVKCVINPDAHRAERLHDLWFGIGIARKGWLTKAEVMNCLPLGKIEKALATKNQIANVA